jgi:hypothetical protein
MEQFAAFWWIGAENGTSSGGSERFYMSYGPCSHTAEKKYSRAMAY